MNINQNENEVCNVVKYSNIGVNFSETNLITGGVSEGRFNLVDGFAGRVYSFNEYVMVVLEDGSKGTYTFGADEEFSFRKGLRIAFNLAMIEHLKKETKKLCKE
jgi:hypothetical protein